MRLSTFLATAFASLALAQNSFSFSGEIGTIKAGSAFNITWTPSSKTESVSLVLRQSTGDVNNLATVATIGSKLPNTGSYLWTPSTTLPKGTGYAFQILDDANKNTNSYSSQFTLDTPTSASATSKSDIVVTSVPGPITSITSQDMISVNGTIKTPTATATGESATTTSGETKTTGSSSKTAISTGVPSALGTAPASGGVGLVVSGGAVALGFGALVALL